MARVCNTASRPYTARANINPQIMTVVGRSNDRSIVWPSMSKLNPGLGVSFGTLPFRPSKSEFTSPKWTASGPLM